MNLSEIKRSWQGTDPGFEKSLRSLQRHKQFYAMRDNLRVTVDDFSLARPHVLPCRKRVDCIELAYIHSASGAISLDARNGGPERFEIVPGIRAVFPGNAKSYELDTIFEVAPDLPIKIVTIHIPNPALAALMGTPVHRLPSNLIFDPAMPSPKNICEFCTPMAPSAASAVFQILNCTLEGPAKRLFVESKVLELLSLEVDNACRRGAGPAFRPEEIERLHRARQVMMDSILDPPTLKELGRKVGLNEKKIKTGFRTLFGETVYGFLQSYRMETARRLMENRFMGVSEAAWAVGYVNVSHFSAAFRKRFGVLPGAYLKGLKNGSAPHG